MNVWKNLRLPSHFTFLSEQLISQKYNDSELGFFVLSYLYITLTLLKI